MLSSGLFSVLLAVAPSLARHLPRGVPGGSLYDQVRFLDCDKGLMTGYYAAPPMGADPPSAEIRWTNVDAGSSWTNGSSLSKHVTPNGHTYEWNVRKFKPAANTVKTYVGNVTYDGEGFNCFADDGHAVNIDGKFAQCHATIFCIHHDATIINFSASTDVVSWQSHSTGPSAPPVFTDSSAQTAVNDIMAKVKKSVTGPMTCDSSEIDIGNSCSMLVSCESSDNTGEALTALVNGMVYAYSNNDTLFKAISSDECHGEWMTSCNHYRGVAIPSRYRLAIVNVAPPEGDGSLIMPGSSSLKATLDVEITCDEKENDPFLCLALELATIATYELSPETAKLPIAGFGAVMAAACG